MQYFDLITVEFETYKCKYCERDLTGDGSSISIGRIDVTDLNGHWQFSFCDTEECYRKHTHEFYKTKNINHVCYENGCMQK